MVRLICISIERGVANVWGTTASRGGVGGMPSREILSLRPSGSIWKQNKLVCLHYIMVTDVKSIAGHEKSGQVEAGPT